MGLAEDLAYYTGRVAALPGEIPGLARRAGSGLGSVLDEWERSKGDFARSLPSAGQLGEQLARGAAGAPELADPNVDQAPEPAASWHAGSDFGHSATAEKQIRALGGSNSVNLAPHPASRYQSDMQGGFDYEGIDRATRAGKAETNTPGSIKYQMPGGEWKEWTPKSEIRDSVTDSHGVTRHGGFVSADIDSLGPQQRIDYDRAAAESAMARALAKDPFAFEHEQNKGILERTLLAQGLQQRGETERRSGYMHEIQMNDAAHQKRIAEINADAKLTPEQKKQQITEADAQHETIEHHINSGFGIGARMTSNELYKD